MKAGFIVAAVLMFGMHSANAQNLTELAQFAESICGDIPKGELTKTNIKGKIEANVGLVAKVISGNAALEASKAREIYEGIPFDKLPDKFPTVSMCKLELIKILRSTPEKQGQVYPGRRSDLRTVGRYIGKHRFGSLQKSFDPCLVPDVLDSTNDLYVDDKMIRTSHYYIISEERCPTKRTKTSREEECSANLSDLDEVIDVRPIADRRFALPPTRPSSYAPECGNGCILDIRCLAGSCVSCKVQPPGAQNLKRDWATHEMQSVFHVYVTPTSFIHEEFNDFARALSRIVSGGSDEAFCKAHPSYCQQ